jgi:mannose/cellobiose epimerase-like protein (N-acyl-D-glucosamine 2-epimerase family)
LTYKCLALTVGLAILSTPALAQFDCVYLQQPELNIGFVDSCATFWLQTWDDDLGGFYTNVDRDGTILTAWGTNKNMLTQSRNAYGLVRAYQMTGTQGYLDTARDALEWMYDHAWDQNHGGWINELDRFGNPTQPTADKTAFYQHYALLGIAAYVQATGDTTMFNRLFEGYDWLEEHMWDDREGLEGYYDNVNYDGSFPNGKSFNATVDAITTHVLLLELLNSSPQYLVRLEQLADQIQTYLVASMPDQAIGFAEEYTSNWDVNPNDTMTLMGHVLKSAWCLGRIYRLTGEESLLEDASTLMYDVWDNGYDHDFGGPYKDYNRLTGEMLLWGNPDSTKAWWQMEQAVVAGLELHDLLVSPEPLELADESMQFFMTHFVDREYGEVYADRTRYGDFAWNEAKGSGGKAGYHSIETGYYSYLYSSLFVLGESVTLNYLLEPSDVPRIFSMRPVASEAGTVRITSVLLNGGDFHSFSEESVLLAAGEGGHFEVTFDSFPSAVDEIVGNPPANSVELVHVYPNPFNGTTQLQFTLSHENTVEINVFNLAGQRVLTLPSQSFATGSHTLFIDLNTVSSGQYIARLNTPETMKTVRLTLIH